MGAGQRIKLKRNEFTRLLLEVDGMCPMCSEKLLYTKGTKENSLAQVAHIYPHRPSEEEEKLLKDVPRLSDDPEDIRNLIMLCPNCHQRFDHPRTKEEYMELFQLKKQLLDRESVEDDYKAYCIEDDIIDVLESVGDVDVESDKRKLSYNVMTVRKKMNQKASNAVMQLVLRNVQDYYIPIREALVQIEKEHPGKSEVIAREVSVFYKKLRSDGLTQDDIYIIIL